jgi:hypothetical protein
MVTMSDLILFIPPEMRDKNDEFEGNFFLADGVGVPPVNFIKNR